MIIRIMYKDNKYDMVKASRLDEFLESGRVAMFRRRTGWVCVGLDPVRSANGNTFFTEFDRRARGPEGR